MMLVTGNLRVAGELVRFRGLSGVLHAPDRCDDPVFAPQPESVSVPLLDACRKLRRTRMEI